jgi:hypothetical protein
VVLGDGKATGIALIDFLKLRHARGVESGWIMRQLLKGERPVKVTTRIESGQGRATVHLERVEISGVPISGSALDFLVDKFLLTLYPEAKIGRPFELQHRVDRVEIRPAEVRFVVKN